MAMVRLLMNLATIAILFGSTMAANHTVGAPQGRWDQSTGLTTWAASETFLVGDSLIFVYTPNHDVLEVRKSDYDSCQTTNAISTNGGGMTIISLSSTGKRYFICGTGGHCASGMKLEVNTLATVPPPPVKSPVSAPSPKIAPKISPVSAPSPKNAPKISPVSAPSPKSLAPSAPKSSPPATSPETPSLSPSSTEFVPTSSPSSSPSSADKVSVIASSTVVGFGLVIMMLFFM
uniref:Phytocyanin domain-containing protein n=1 Tax=Solanum lycopersicum TaxID=4081 RepID=A0A3Q7J1N2_SOLLC|nr:uclacyanin 1-like [Solanum lycopersicum]